MIGRVRSPYTSILELEYAFVDAGGQLPCVVSGKRPGPLLMDRRALLQMLRHPVRDHVDAHSVQCVWLQLQRLNSGFSIAFPLLLNCGI
eukprot:XP_001704493.1 Hypothetical protein GL50803_9633 [Giardia lamblia ATCC 50803]